MGYLLDGKHAKSNLYRLVDLFSNAQRRANEGRFDDAVARLYRIIEFIAQIRLQAKGIDSGDVELSRLSPELQKKYQKFQDQEGKVRLPLYRDFELLHDLGDPLGERFFADCKLRDLLQCRNNSILAHGNEAVSEEIYTKMHDQVIGYVLEIVPQFEKLSCDALFPKHGEIIRELEKEVS